jgi:tetratricopeptide (TPR) repeat protein
MTEHCKYHPTQPSHWDCPSCNNQFCNNCVKERPLTVNGIKTGDIHICPDCNVETAWVGASNLIVPFWTRLTKIFLYPFSANPLILSLIISLSVCFLSWIPFANLILYAILIKYAFSILKTTMRGNLNPPKIDALFTTEDFGPVIKQWIMYAALGVAGAFFFLKLGLIAGIVYALVISYSLPSMIMLLVTSEKLGHALNPVMFLGFAVKIGKGYLIMWIFLFLLLSAPGALGYYVIQYLPKFSQQFLITFAENMYTFITYHLMGYVILQYHENIGHEIDYEDFQENTSGLNSPNNSSTQAEHQDTEKESAFQTDGQSEITGQAELLTREGKLDEAIAYIKEATVETGITSIVLMERYYNLLKLKKQTPEMIALGKGFLHKLIKLNERKKACQVFMDCATADNLFKPSSRDLLKAGSWLKQANKTKASVNAYARLIKFYPENRLVPKTYFILAQIYNEKLKNKAQAKKILNILLKKFPEHDIVEHAKQYIQQLG